MNVTAMVDATNSYLDELHTENPADTSSATIVAGGFVIRTTFNHAAMIDAVRAANSQIYGKLGSTSVPDAKTGAGVQIGLATVTPRTAS